MRHSDRIAFIRCMILPMLITVAALAQDAQPTEELVEPGVLPAEKAAVADSPVAAQIDTVRFAKNYAVLLKTSYPHSIWDQVRDGFTSAFIIGFVTLFVAVAITVGVSWLMIRCKLLWIPDRFSKVVMALWIVTIAIFLVGCLDAGGDRVQHNLDSTASGCGSRPSQISWALQ